MEISNFEKMKKIIFTPTLLIKGNHYKMIFVPYDEDVIIWAKNNDYIVKEYQTGGILFEKYNS